jgi:hypothetical protein
MTISERDRLALYRRLQDTLGTDHADTLMELLPPTGWGDVATRADLHATATELRGEMAELRGEMAELRGEMAELRGEMAVFRGEMVAGFAGVDQQIAGLKLEIVGMQRSYLQWLIAFGLTIWLTLLAASIIG